MTQVPWFEPMLQEEAEDHVYEKEIIALLHTAEGDRAQVLELLGKAEADQARIWRRGRGRGGSGPGAGGAAQGRRGSSPAPGGLSRPRESLPA